MSLAYWKTSMPTTLASDDVRATPAVLAICHGNSSVQLISNKWILWTIVASLRWSASSSISSLAKPKNMVDILVKTPAILAWDTRRTPQSSLLLQWHILLLHVEDGGDANLQKCCQQSSLYGQYADSQWHKDCFQAVQLIQSYRIFLSSAVFLLFALPLYRALDARHRP